jgi:hypothetical protein
MTQADPGALSPRVLEAIDRVISVQRPVVLAHLRGIRKRHPEASPIEVLRILERRYLTAVTTGGAAVGATAMVPAVGTGTALALSGAETVGFLEATALFAQSATELHGIALEDPERARALVLAMLVGGPSRELVMQFAGQATGSGPKRTAFWGELITKNLPRTMVSQFADQIRRVYLPRLIVTQTGSVVGRIIPFGIGAVVGGVGNQMLGRTIVRAERVAFGPPPSTWPAELAIVVRAPKEPKESREAKRARKATSERPTRRYLAVLPTRRKRTSVEETPPQLPPPPPPAPETRREAPPPAPETRLDGPAPE